MNQTLLVRSKCSSDGTGLGQGASRPLRGDGVQKRGLNGKKGRAG